MAEAGEIRRQIKAANKGASSDKQNSWEKHSHHFYRSMLVILIVLVGLLGALRFNIVRENKEAADLGVAFGRFGR